MKKIKFDNNIRFKITSAMILCSIIIPLLMGSISVYNYHEFFKKEIIEKFTLLPEKYSNIFNTDFRVIQSSVNTLRQYISLTFDEEKFTASPEEYVEQYEKEMDLIIRKIAETTNKKEGIYTTNEVTAVYLTLNPELTGDVHEIWYADEEGNGTLKKLDSDSNPEDPYIEWFYHDNKEMQWYYEPIKKGRGVWSDPYKEEDLNIEIISYTEPILKDDILIGVIGMDINIDVMKNTIENMKVYDTGYAFLMCDEFHFLIHPTYTSEDNLKVVENGEIEILAKEIGSNNSGIMKCKCGGSSKTFGYSRLCNGWILTFAAPTYEVFSSLITQLVLNGIVLVLTICIIIMITIYLGKSISNPIVKITELIKNIANFNFVDDKSLSRLVENKDEIGIMAKEMLNTRKILKATGVDKAAKLQRQYLQNEFPIPDKIDMELLYVPSKTVSGDFYHLEKINDNLVVGVIWDVSGKGVTAALNISAVNVLFNRAVLSTQNPVEILHDLNIKVTELLGEAYIAACCFSFDFENNIAKIAGAGINQFMYSSDKEFYQEKDVKGPFLGMFEDSIFEQEIINFKPGDKFYFLTDGLEFMFYDEELRKEFLNISDNSELIKYLYNYLNTIKTEIGSIMDDSTLITFEIK